MASASAQATSRSSDDEGEKRPLLTDSARRSLASYTEHMSHYTNMMRNKLNIGKQGCVVEYDTQALGTFEVFTYTGGTVITSSQLWRVMGILGVVVVIMGAIIPFFPNLQHIEVDGFRKISTFLRVFVAFLLGFFMANAVQTWKSTVNGLLLLCNAVRNTQMQLLSLGVSIDKSDLVVRYGVMSVFFLYKELEDAHLRDDAIKLKNQESHLDELQDKELLKTEERSRIESMDDKSSLMWLWIMAYVGRMAVDGEVPAMSSPTYGRLMEQAAGGLEGIRQVRTSVSVQVPFIYVHTLAALVHLNSILCAITLGMSLGVFFGNILVDMGLHPVEGKHDLPADMYQQLFVALMSQGMGPFMYTAFLQISLAFSYPVGPHSEAARIPGSKFISALIRDTSQANALILSPPSWERAVFKDSQKK
mmetsp:Transcript_10406/g.23553  ORF Transcript_10406/g.23553 Transcript_10406/m.23553 type:complete len:419 (-) Transcript_10406:164-1420(-)